MLATPLGAGIFRYLALHLTIPRLHPVDEFRAVSLQSDGALIAYAVATAIALPLAWRAGAGAAPPAAGVGARRAGGAQRALRRRLRAVRRAAARGGGEPRSTRCWPPGASAPARGHDRVGAAGRARARAARCGGARRASASSTSGSIRTPLPLEAIQFVEENGLRERMYNDFEIGSYLIVRRLSAPPRVHRSASAGLSARVSPAAGALRPRRATSGIRRCSATASRARCSPTPGSTGA